MSNSSLTFFIFFKDEDGEDIKRKLESKSDYATFKKEVLKKCSAFFGGNKNKQIIFHLKKEVANCKIKFFYNEETYSYILQAYKDEDSIRINLEEQFGEFPEYTLNPLTKNLLNLIEEKSTELKKYVLSTCTENVMSSKQESYDKCKINQEIQHNKVMCKCCLEKDIQGVRYLCAECPNYNICELCEHKKKHSHPRDHLFIRINQPISLSQNYGCVFPENGFLLRLTGEEQKMKNVCVKILNVGEDNLKGCMLCSVGFGKKYVGGKKVVIKQDVKKGGIVDVHVELNTQGKGMFETKWRMFSKDGLPFGDLFKCKVEVVSM